MEGVPETPQKDDGRVKNTFFAQTLLNLVCN